MEITDWACQLKVWLIGLKWRRCIAYWCIQNNWSIAGIYFSIVYDFRPWRASQNQESFRLFFFSGSHNLSFFLPGYFVQETSMLNTYLTWFLGQNQAFLHRGLWFSGYLVYLQMLPFCILQRVSKHCVAMLILLNLHWQAALMVFFYVFVWLFLVSMATDCTWWQATGRYSVNLGLVSLSYFSFYSVQ